MPLSIAAIVPHSPLLMPTIGKEQQVVLQPTLNAYEQLAAEFAQRRVETIVIIGDHGFMRPEVFTLNQNPTLDLNLKEFGDLVSVKQWPNDLKFSNLLKEKNETTLPLVTVASSQISYVISVPLYLLTKYLPKVKVCPIGSCLNITDGHLALGEILREVAENFTANIALLAANDLGPTTVTDDNSNVGDSDFNKLINRTVTNQSWHELITHEEDFNNNLTALPLRNILVVGGALQNTAWQPEILAYQAPLGVGMITAVFRS